MNVLGKWRSAATAILLSLASGCIGLRGGALPAYDYPRLENARSVAAAPFVDYRVRFVGSNPKGSEAFAERVGHVFAGHRLLVDARPGDGGTPLHLDLTLSNRSNRLVAGLTGLASGLTFTLLPAYARDDFELTVELRAGPEVLKHYEYRDSVVTVIHFTFVFIPRTSQPRAVVEDVVDNMLMHALWDLDESGLLKSPEGGEAGGR